MSAAGEGSPPTQDPSLILIPDGLIPDAQGGYAPHPALRFAASRLNRAARRWAESPAMAPIEWYAALLGAGQGASRLLAAAMGDDIPDDARQCWLVSPFAGRLGRDTVHIMPDEAFAWDSADAAWLAGMLEPLLTGDGLRLLSRDGCMLALTSSPWDARPASFARVAGHVLPDRHPPGADGGKLMRLCAEMQMLLASRPSERRRAAGLPAVMGVWLWGPSELPAGPVARPRMVSDDALIRACVDAAAGSWPAAILRASQVEAHIEGQAGHGRLPRYWLLGGEHHAVLLDTRSLPRFSRRPWLPRGPVTQEVLAQHLRRICSPMSRV